MSARQGIAAMMDDLAEHRARLRLRSLAERHPFAIAAVAEQAGISVEDIRLQLDAPAVLPMALVAALAAACRVSAGFIVSGVVDIEPDTLAQALMKVLGPTVIQLDPTREGIAVNPDPDRFPPGDMRLLWSVTVSSHLATLLTGPYAFQTTNKYAGIDPGALS